jgi:hypothetical protein
MPALHPSLADLPATGSDGFLLGLESLMRRRRQGRHLAATVLECEGAPDLAAIRRSAEILGHRYPILQARIARSRRDWIARWRLHEAESAAIPVACWHLPGIPAPGVEVLSLEDFIATCLHGSDIDIHAPGPNLRLHVVVTAPDRWSLVVVWSHSLLDAVGMTKFLRELAAPGEEGAARSGGSEGVPPVIGIGGLYRQALPMIAEMRSFPSSRVRSLHRKACPAGPCRFQVTTFDPAATAAIRAKMAATAGELLLLPYFASCAARAVRAVIAARHPDEAVPVLISLPVQRQSDPAKRPLFQNHMVPYTLLLTAEELAELKPAARALFRKYSDFMRRKLPAAMDALMRMMERCPSRCYNLPAFHYMRGEICTLFHSHTGEFAAGLGAIFGSRLLNGYNVPSVGTPPGIGIFFSEHEGRLTLTLSWREGCLSPLELDLMKSTLADDLGTPLP